MCVFTSIVLCRTVFVSGSVVGFGELFRASFLIDPTGIKLSSFQGSLPNLGTAYITFRSTCITFTNCDNFLASATHVNRLFGSKGVGILCYWELKDHLVWLQVDWSQVANKTTLNPVFYFLILGEKKNISNFLWIGTIFLGLTWIGVNLPLSEALLKCQLPLKEKETAISFHLLNI